MNKEHEVKANLSNKERAVNFLQLVASGKVKLAFKYYVGNGFRHHNPFFREDADSLMKAMEEDALNNPNKKLEVKQIIEDNQKVVVHSHVKQHSDDLGLVLVHIFRFQDDLIVELWDVGQPIPENTINESGAF